MLLSCDHLTFRYTDAVILDGVSFSVSEGEKIGLIGGNGEGKTTLFRLMLGELSPDQGTVFRKNALKIGYLSQTGGFESQNTVYEEMRSVFREDLADLQSLRTVQTELAVTRPDSDAYRRLCARLEALEKRIAAHDAYQIDVRIRTVLNGMGFADFYDRTISHMSGGEKTRLKLCRLLLEQPDLLMLDEPTNHLDVKTLFWLEEYLADYKGALFIVSHDRYFLDRCVRKILELEDTKLSEYRGNYSKYKVLKAEKLALQQKEYEKQQTEIAHLEDYVNRNLVRATTAKSAQSRVKQLDRMERLEKPKPPKTPPRFSFTYAEPPYERVLEVEHLSLSAGGKVLLPDLSLRILRGEKVALIGDNGTGKSTFLHEIIRGNPAIRTARFTRIAYYDQENANLNPQNTVLEELWGRFHGKSQTDIRARLAAVKLDAEDIDKKVGALSGGERAKLALAVFQATEGNFLILDEPTNHLDLAARESLEEALKVFTGTILFVSHDRYFIQAIANRIVEFADGTLHTFTGDYESYRALQREKTSPAPPPAKPEKRVPAAMTREQKQAEARRKQRVKEIEKALTQLEHEEAAANAELADPAITADYAALTEVCQKLEALRSQIDALYQEYETLEG